MSEMEFSIIYLEMRVFSETMFSRLSQKIVCIYSYIRTELSICVRGHRKNTVEHTS